MSAFTGKIRIDMRWGRCYTLPTASSGVHWCSARRALLFVRQADSHFPPCMAVHGHLCSYFRRNNMNDMGTGVSAPRPAARSRPGAVIAVIVLSLLRAILTFFVWLPVLQTQVADVDPDRKTLYYALL